jgi:putative ATPase
MRPRSLDEVIGQEHVLGPGSALRTAIESGKPHSAILYGPPGAGKTTLARIAAAGAEGAFEEESAVNAGKAEIRAVIERARERRRASGRPTILFLDEIHRFNKAQQDALLPAVEDGTLTLIGATTENPYFEVNTALLSRAQDYELQPLEPEGGRTAAPGDERSRARDRRAAGGERGGAGDAGHPQRRRRPGRARRPGASGGAGQRRRRRSRRRRN